MDDPAAGWKQLGAVAPEALVDARLQLHWAVQLLAATADALLDARPDDSHTNFRPYPALGAWLGNPLPRGDRVGLRPATLELLVVGEAGRPAATCGLTGETLDAARRWLQGELTARCGRPVELRRRDYEMPDHPVGRGAPFLGDDAAAFAELGRTFHDADLVLTAFAAGDPRATDVAVWPHHFDAGAILFVDRGDDPEGARQIGFGMSPGDHHLAEPYFYVTPWPIPDGTELPPIDGGGSWHRGDFTGAVLPASRLLGAPTAEAQRRQVERYLRSAVAIGLELVGDR